MITQSRLFELVKYDPENGSFVAIASRGNIRSGKILGSSNGDGYLKMDLDGRPYFSHRLAFLYMTGSIPEMVDHRDGDRGNNRFDNLRAANPIINARNAAKKAGSASRFRGVTQRGIRWKVIINAGGRKQRFIGEFKNEVHAAYAYDLASIELHGEFGRRNFLPLVYT